MYFCPKQGQDFKPPAAPLYPNMGQVPPPGTRTLIDHIFTNKPDIITNHGVLHVCISDHGLIYAIHKHNTPKTDPKVIESRQFKNVDSDAFIDDIKETPFHLASLLDDPNEMWLVWKSLFLEIANKHAP